ncbi:hypothetical protein Ahy_B06g083723 [Arachis hypogaea]|uniref:SWIM-type domain-containing protein n=1 Tax=Arachis hypogaea TaxID=3818 RepID=A0A444YQI1_ARAHY|nr:hypothetical protein Ahy_B06g083723 [Arachis hypogaea]
MESQPKPKSKCKPKTVSKPKPMPRQNNVTRTRRYCLRSVGKGISKAKKNASDHVLLSSDSDSHDSYESAEDEAYKPQEPDDSSDESGIGYTVPSQKKKVKKPNARKKVQAESRKEKGKAKVCVDDVGFVEDVSDEDVDIGFVGGGIKGDNHDAFDPGSESDGGNSWHSLEMKTPPNSEDELVGEESSEDVFPVFRQGARFGELHLEVGMKFNTKWEFKEAVREFTIQEGRRMRFRKNDGKRVRAVCKVKDCKWVVYASRDHEDSCWQVKTFFNDHTCPREDKNEAANRNWVAGKLVKKLRKYPNFRNCKVRKESRHWHAIWSGDTGYEKFEVHGRPTNHVVDLGKRLCTCQFWMLTGIPCVHACAALARVNKHPEDFYHKLITMESYKKTYKYHINPIPGQAFWEQSQFNKPLAPPIKRKPGNLQTKRRKDSDEVSSSSKKSKSVTALKRQLRPFTWNQPQDLPNCLLEEGPSTALEPMKGASSATASRFTNFLKFVPTPGFKHPRKK